MAKLFDTSITGSLIISNYIKLEANDNPVGEVGSIRFNSSTQKLNLYYESFNAITAIPNGHESRPGGAGSYNSAAVFGGASFSLTDLTDEWNGASWSAGGAMNAARSGLAGTGTQNDAHAINGYTIPSGDSCSETYNGSTWAVQTMLNNPRTSNSAGGNTSATAVTFGDVDALFAYCTEEFNGSTWSNTNSVGVRRYFSAAAGSQNATINAGGFRVPQNFQDSCVEEYNGNTWASKTGMIRTGFSLSGFGKSNSMVVTGTTSGVSEKYNGIAWEIGPNQVVSRGSHAAAGTSIVNGGLIMGGSPSACETCAEEYRSQIKTWNFE